ncbi:hypothetical protein L7F22_045938 [Adiantum nelumboides]|nr:hypothetical protein [Adiantum nelumboides]
MRALLGIHMQDKTQEEHTDIDRILHKESTSLHDDDVGPPPPSLHPDLQGHLDLHHPPTCPPPLPQQHQVLSPLIERASESLRDQLELDKKFVLSHLKREFGIGWSHKRVLQDMARLLRHQRDNSR